MSKRKLQFKIRFLLGVVISSISFGCTESFDPPNLDFQEILVIDAILTTELKEQEIFLSRTFTSNEEVELESNARVLITDDLGNTIAFVETEPGRYGSQVDFGAQPNRTYSLQITTENGSVFRAGPAQAIGNGILEQLSASVTTNENGTEGISIFASGQGFEESASSFRFDYEETYLVISPFTSPEDLVVVSENPVIFDVVPKTREEQICYRTISSNNILITNSESLTSNQVQNFEVKFIPKNDFSISHRYSISVNQYIQSPAAQGFYEDLREFSNVQTLFSQTQPGFVRGNIEAAENVGERVLGIFEIASVSSQRLFFNRSDFFPDEPIPDHIIPCNTIDFFENDAALLGLIQSGSHKLVSQELVFPDSIIFFVVESGCVDCTLYGTNVRPDFWVD
ncbi:MAG: DUF4249 domain-containing protein [Bacteroidota bacterium]